MLILYTYDLFFWNAELMSSVKDTQNDTFEHLNQNTG